MCERGGPHGAKADNEKVTFECSMTDENGVVGLLECEKAVHFSYKVQQNLAF